MSDAPIAVLGGGAGTLACARALQRRLPVEDVLCLCDGGYAPWAERPGAVVRDRVLQLGRGLAARGAKVLVLASLQGGVDALAELQAALAIPVIGLDAALAGALQQGGAGPIWAVHGVSCTRGAATAKALRAQRGGGRIEAVALPGLREAVEAGRPEEAEPAIVAGMAAARSAGVGTLVLACPHACAVAERARAAADGIVVLDAAEVAAERAQRVLLHAGALARRRRPGRLLLQASDAAPAQRALASAAVRRPPRRPAAGAGPE